jgi:hypothetical protein
MYTRDDVNVIVTLPCIVVERHRLSGSLPAPFDPRSGPIARSAAPRAMDTLFEAALPTVGSVKPVVFGGFSQSKYQRFGALVSG